MWGVQNSFRNDENGFYDQYGGGDWRALPNLRIFGDFLDMA